MTTNPKPLNRAEVWVADHAVPIFLAIAVAILLGAGAVFYNWQKQGDTASEVHVLEPQVTKINKAICDRASLKDDRRARACAGRIRIGLINCRRSQPCRAAYLALATYPPPAQPVQPGGGDAFQQPSHQGHQQPGPHGGGHGEGHQGGQEPGAKSPEPSPQAESAPPAGDSGAPPANESAPPHPAAKAVEQVEDAVNETVEGVKGAACGLAKSC